MPSTRSKEDTWTTNELNQALKRDDRKSHRDRDDDKRRRSDINGDDKHRRRRDEDEKRRHRDDDDKRRQARDDDRRSSKHKDEEKREIDVSLTEEERERLRRERREKREKTGKSDGKEIAFRGRSENEHLKSTKEDEQSKSQHHNEDDRKGRHHKDADDNDKEQRSRHRDEDIDNNSRRKQREDDQKRHRQRDIDDDEKHRRHRDDDEKRRRHRDDDHDEKRRRHRGDDDNEKQRRHREEEDKDREIRKHRDDREGERERQRLERRERRERGERSHSKKDKDEDEERNRRHENKKDGRKDDDWREDDKDKRKDRDDRKHRRDKVDDDDGLRRPDKHRSHDSRKEKREEKENADDDYNYEDDFENYEEDFEEDDDGEDLKPITLHNITPGQILDYSYESLQKTPRPGTMLDYPDSEVDEILRALDEENNRLLHDSHKEQRSESTGKTSKHYQDNSDEEEVNNKSHSDDRAPTVSRARTVINFVSAKQRAMSRKTANKTIQRGRDLLQMLELDVAKFDLLDLPPVKEYDLYIRSFGRTDTKQAYVQTNDDNIDRDIQTEEIDSRQKWTQHPPEDFLGVGRGDGKKDFEEEEQSQMKQNKEQDLGRLHKFLANAGQVMGILLDEKRDEETRGESANNKSSISISQGYSQLVVLNILAGRYVEFACFSPTQPNFLLTLYSKAQTISVDKPIDKKGIICVWNTNEPFYPQKILACQSQPKCCCFSPVKPTLVFAGMVDGSIAVWDLREIASQHKSVVAGNQEYIIRFPTYNTAGVLDNENHHSPVNSICPVYSYMTMSNKSDQQLSDSNDDSSAGLSFQLVSMEDMAVLHFWVVAEIMHPDPSGSESDLGLAPGGRVKLLKSSFLTLDGPTRDGFFKTSMRALSMQLLPSDPNQFYIATDLGFVFHGVRFSSRAYPNTHSAEIQKPLDVTCIDFSPFEKPCFLAGYKDGSFSLYHTKLENPILTWSSVTQGRSILSVMWSRSRPCLFFVFDDSSNMYIFDLLEGYAAPKYIETVSKERVVNVSCSTDHKATGLGLPGRHPQLFISLESGKTEIHTLAKSVRDSEPLEAEFLVKFLDRF